MLSKTNKNTYVAHAHDRGVNGGLLCRTAAQFLLITNGTQLTKVALIVKRCWKGFDLIWHEMAVL